MGAYNRIIRRFVDGFDITANDLNAALDDLRFELTGELQDEPVAPPPRTAPLGEFVLGFNILA